MKLLRKLLGKSYSEALVAEPTQEDQDNLTRQIHSEIDGIEEHYLGEITEMLNSIQIPTTNQVTKKADLMESLGFPKTNETVKQGVRLKEEIKEAEVRVKTNKERLELINKYRLAYPNDKIIPMEEFQKVLKKYNLIYAPSKAYIKDIPEKNLIEIKEARQTVKEHSAIEKFVVNGVSLSWISPNYMAKWDFSDIVLKPSVRHIDALKVVHKFGYTHIETSKWHIEHYQKPSEDYTFEKTTVPELCVMDYTAIQQVSDAMSKRTGIDKTTIQSNIDRVSFVKVERNKLFIAAPKSHFDLSNLAKDGKEYYESQKVSVTITKDPIAVYILKGVDSDHESEFVRIISKWGTSDDQSYLDPIIQNQRDN